MVDQQATVTNGNDVVVKSTRVDRRGMLFKKKRVFRWQTMAPRNRLARKSGLARPMRLWRRVAITVDKDVNSEEISF